MNTSPSSESVNNISNLDADSINITIKTTNEASLVSASTLFSSKTSESLVEAVNSEQRISTIGLFKSLNSTNITDLVNMAFNDVLKVFVEDNNYKIKITNLLLPKPKETRKLSDAYNVKEILSMKFQINKNSLIEILSSPNFPNVFMQNVCKNLCYSHFGVSKHSGGNSSNILENNFITNKPPGLKSRAIRKTSTSALEPEASLKPPTTMMTQSTDLATDMIYSRNLHREQNQWQEPQVHCESCDLDCLSNYAYTFEFVYDGIQPRESIKTISTENILNDLILCLSEKEYRCRNAQNMYASKQSSTHVIIEGIQIEEMKRILFSTLSYDRTLILIPIELLKIVLEELMYNSIEKTMSLTTFLLNILVDATSHHHIKIFFSSEIHVRPEFAGHEQPTMVQRQYFSDVRDTSSQKVLVSIARAQFKTCPSEPNQGTATEPEPSQLASLSTLSTTPLKSSFLARLRDILLPQPIPLTSPQLNFFLWYEKLPNLKILPKFTKFEWIELDKWIYIIKCLTSVFNIQGDQFITKTKRPPLYHFDDLVERKRQISTRKSGKSQEENYRSCQPRVEMTISTFEEHDEAEATAAQLSEPLSLVISLDSRQEEINGSTDILYEMKFEMRATKSPLASSSTQDRLKSGLSSGTSSTSKSTPRPLGQAIDTIGAARSQLPTLASNMITSRHQRPQLTSLPSRQSGLRPGMDPEAIKDVHTSTSRQQQLSSYSSGSKSMDSPSNRQLEKSASDTLRSYNVTPFRSISVDPVDSGSKLPASTRLRRQRRIDSQESTDQPEDPIERLNRLRARISGALSEVKGVLNKYSTETDPNDEVAQKDPKTSMQATAKDDGPVQFRFIRKIRRRSVFIEEEEKNIGDSSQTENASEKTGSAEGPLKLESTTSSAAEEKTEIGKHKGSAQDGSQNSGDKTSGDNKNAGQDVLHEQIIPKIGIEAPETKILNEKNKKESNENSCEKKTVSKNSPKLGQALKPETQNSKRRVSIATVAEVDPEQSLKEVETQRRPSDSSAILKKVSQVNSESKKGVRTVADEISKKGLNEARSSKKLSSVAEFDKKVNTTQKEPLTAGSQAQESTPGAESKAFEKIKTPSPEDIESGNDKPGKSSSTKKTTNTRRSSIAVVESPKSSGPFSDSTTPDIKTQRRPSDSAAIVRKISAAKGKGCLIPLKGSTHKEGSPKKFLPAVPIVGKKPRTPTASDIANDCKNNDVIVSSAAGEPTKSMPTNSMKVINDETSTTSSIISGTSLLPPPPVAKVIGRATTVKTSEAAVTPTNKTDISDDMKDSIIPLISDVHENKNTTSAISSPQLNETNGQQAQSGLSPNVHRISGISAVSVKKFIPLSTENTVQKIIDPQWEKKDITSKVDQVIQPPETVATNAAINQITTKTEKAESQQYSQPETRAEQQDGNIKKPIHQQEIIPATINKPVTLSTQSTQFNQSTQLLRQSVQEKSLQESASESASASASATAGQQVAVDAELAPIANGDDTRVNDRVPETIQPTARKSLSEVDIATSLEISDIPTDSSTDNACTKANASTVANYSGPESIIESSEPTKSKAQSSTEEPKSKSESRKKLGKKVPEKMPELQVLPSPVKAVQVHPVSEVPSPFDESKDVFPKKRILFKKIGRKSSTEKTQPPKIIHNKDEITPSKEIAPEAEEEQKVEVPETPVTEAPEATENLETLEIPPIEEPEEPPALPKPPRQVKKKVIIKRLQRRLSATEQSFFLGENEDKPVPDVETIEKAIAYVSDDEEGGDEKESIEPIKPVKSCMRLREYQVGDLVMYAERYRKTLIRWKRGRVIERITSISYKIDIDGKEVSAHINYLKKYTGRKVRFGDKEYLEIEYEQIAEEEKKLPTYSIWNLV